MKMVSRRFILVSCLMATAALVSIGFRPRATFAEEPINVGSVLFLSGPAASYGEMQKAGFDIALEEINGTGGINGRRLEVIYEDSGHDQQKAVAAVKKLIAQDKVPMIVEVTGSGEAVAVAPVIHEYKVVFLSAIDSAEKLSGISPYFFRIMPSDAFQGQFLAQWALELSWKKPAAFYVKNEWGEGMLASVRKHFEQAGGSLALAESSTDKDIDFRTQLTKIKAARPDGVFLLLYPEAAGRALKQARQLELNIAFLGGDALSGDEVVQLAGESADGLMFCLPTKGSGPVFEKFSKSFEKKFDKPASIYSIKSYDAMRIAGDALRAKGPSAEGIREYLSGLKDYQGAGGLITLDKNGDIITQKFEKFIYRNGKYGPLGN